jgi:pilus assembly protein CpaF
MTGPDGRDTRLSLESDDVQLGSSLDNDVVIPPPGVDPVHARMVFKDGRIVVITMGGESGSFMNGVRLSKPAVLRPGDSLRIGEHTFRTASDGTAPPPVPAPAPRTPAQPSVRHQAVIMKSQSAQRAPRVESESPKIVVDDSLAPPPAAPQASAPVQAQRKAPAGQLEAGRALRKKIHDRLIEFMDLRRLDITKFGDAELRRRAEGSVREIIGQMGREGAIPAGTDIPSLVKDILDEALGLGPLEEFLADESITEIMVNNAHQIYIERAGLLLQTDRTFTSDAAVMAVIERIVAPIGRRIDESSPMVDARLKDGSRVNAIIPPLALKGPSITIRKFKKDKMSMNDLMNVNSISQNMVEFLKTCVLARRNCVISGGTGSGKTTLLNGLSTFIPETERIVTVEDAAELQLKQEHWVSLEARPPNIEGKGQITIRDLVKNCLRMRPDRIVVGECRGGESLDMLQAMNTGHDGSLTTVHANSPRDSLSRLETMVLMSGMDLPIRAIREQITSAINIVVQLSRFPDGSRKVTHITEITGMEVDIISMQHIFEFKQEGFDPDGRVRGRYVATGLVPRFFDDLQKRGIRVDMSIFN